MIDRIAPLRNVRCKWRRRLRLTVEVHNRNLIRSLAQQRTKHRVELRITRKLPASTSARLYQHHQRQWPLVLFLKRYLLWNSIVGQNKIIRRKRKHQLFPLRLQQRRNNNQRSRRMQRRLCNRRATQSSKGSNEFAESQLHRVLVRRASARSARTNQQKGILYRTPATPNQPRTQASNWETAQQGNSTCH